MPPKEDWQFLLLYGSQTGQAHAIAEDIHHDSGIERLKGKLMCLDQLKEDSLVREKVVIIICSTTGDGDPPDNAAKFVRFLRKKSLANDILKNLKFTVLGLGNTNYTNFCSTAKYINSRLLELGANHFYEPAWADDAVGLDLVVEPWREGLWAHLKEVLLGLPASQPVLHVPLFGVDGAPDMASLSVPPLPDPLIDCVFQQPGKPLPTVKDVPSKSSFQMARLCGYRCLTASDAVRRTLQVELDISGTNLTFEAGDAICVSCPNNPDEVDELLELLGAVDIADTPMVLRPVPGSKRNIPDHLIHATSLRGALTLYCDIRCLPEKKWLRLLAEYATNEEEKQRLLYLSSRQGNETFTKEVRQNCLNLTDLLRLNPSVKLPCARALEIFSPLVSRFYSICTSPLAMPTRVQIAHNIIPNGLPETAMKELPGLCTNWMDFLCGQIRQAVNVQEQRNVWVRVPPQPAASLATSVAAVNLAFPQRPQSPRARAHGWRVGPAQPAVVEAPKPRVVKPTPRPAPAAAPSIGITITIDNEEPTVISSSDSRAPPTPVASRPTTGATRSGRPTESDEEPAPSVPPAEEEAKPTYRLNAPPDPFNILIPVQRRQVNIFRVPSEPTVPVIMVGPGTGVSPFIGFLQHRRAMRAALPAVKFGEMWLFFGNRSHDKDYLFEQELQEYMRDGTLTKVHTAFSRDVDSKARYVQDCMRLHGPELVRLMRDQRGVFFMCGNATQMAVSVDNTWLDILQEAGMTAEEAFALKQKWYETKRYYKDVWG